MVMQSMRKGKAAGLIKFVFMSLLILAAGGLVLTDVGGFFRGGVAGNDVAKIGNQSIPLVSFDQKMRRTISRLGMTPDQAYQLGYTGQILNSEIRSILLQQDARSKGIRIGRELVATQVAEMVAPMTQDGQSAQDVLNQILMSQGLTEAQFVSQLGAEMSAGVLMSAFNTDLLGSSNALTSAMYTYKNETRSLAVVDFPNAKITVEAEPEDQTLQAFYEERKRNYIIPESRTIDLAVIQNDDIESSIEVSDSELREIYDSEIEIFAEPEKRVIEQAIMQTESDAMQVAELANNGTPLKDAVEKVTQKQSGYVAPQSFAQDDMVEAIAEKTFAADKGAVIGPVSTPLGHYIVVVQDITQGQTKDFASVKEELKRELLSQRLQDEKFDRLNLVEDLVAGGATLQEVAQQVPMKIKTFDNITAFSAENALKEYGQDADTILQMTFEYEEGHITPVNEMKTTGAQFVVSVKSVKPESYKPFEEVKDELRKAWIKVAQREQNKQKVEELYDAITKGEYDNLGALAKAQGVTMQTLNNITRDEDAPKPLAQNSLALVFAMEKDNYVITDTIDGYGIAKVTDITLPSSNTANAEDIEQMTQGLSRDSVNELNALYIEKLRKEKDVSINQGLLERMYAPSNTSF